LCLMVSHKKPSVWQAKFNKQEKELNTLPTLS